jgi:hypothetical protein
VPATGGARGWGAGALVGLAVLLMVVAGAAALLFAGGDDGERTAGSGGREPTATAEATAKPEKTAKADKTPTAEPTATATAEPTATATAEPTAAPGNNGNGNGGNGGGGGGKKLGNDAAALQLQAYNFNEAGRPADALPYARRAVQLCEGSTAVSPCAYALYEYARALRGTGDPEAAIQVLEERQQRFPGDQAETVQAELDAARADAGG